MRKKKETKNGDKRVRDRAGESKKDGKEDEGNKEVWLKQKQNEKGDSRMTNWVGKGKRKSDNWEANRWLWKKSREDEKRNWNRQERKLRERENMRKNVRKEEDNLSPSRRRNNEVR